MKLHDLFERKESRRQQVRDFLVGRNNKKSKTADPHDTLEMVTGAKPKENEDAHKTDFSL